MLRHLSDRQSGVLAPVTALPGAYGLGELGPEAFGFIDRLAEAGQTIWQILPLNPALDDGCPYSSPSALANDARLVSIERLVAEGLLSETEAAPALRPSGDRIDYSDVYPARQSVLNLAFEKIATEGGEDFKTYKAKAGSWLDAYALFEALSERLGGREWTAWPEDYRSIAAPGIAAVETELAARIDQIKAGQFVFDRQWNAVRQYAHSKGVVILGDMPIYVSLKSADVWTSPKNFRLDENGRPEAISGCPPDAFSADGQLWGNPLYNWDYQEANGFEWWVARLRRMAELYDIVRLDHFRAFAAYWEIPNGAETAQEGHWTPAPGRALFNTLREQLPSVELIAEDLGDIDDDVEALRDEFAMPGMKIIQNELAEAPFESHRVPANYPGCSVSYIGTHDNDTARGWLSCADESARIAALALSGDGEWDRWAVAKLLFSAGSGLVVHQLQDLLWLDGDARFNVPGTVGPQNWSWRMKPGAFDGDIVEGLNDLTASFGRRRKHRAAA